MNAIAILATDCGVHWTSSVMLNNSLSSPQAPGVDFRTPTFAFVAVDDTNPNVAYVAYQNFVGGNYDIW